MKRKSFLLVLITGLCEVIILGSCQKELSCQSCEATNELPVAKAGTDRTIMLPIDSVTLDGSSSIDPDGSITSYVWTQVTGPNQSTFSNSLQASSLVTNLIEGIYQFELKVTDNGGLSAKDTVQITVNAPSDQDSQNRPEINAQLVPVGILSQARMSITCATAGSKILFAGGLLAGNIISTRVDIYDFVSNTWSTAELSTVRSGMAVATVGNKIFFAGGGYEDFFNGWIASTRVDIYDASTDTWSTAELSEARSDFTAATLGDKAFFAGGYYWNNADFFSRRVDIYDNATNSWSTDSLSGGRAGLCATTVGNKIYFAGGWNGWTDQRSPISSSTIDVYDGTANSWSASSLSEGKSYFAGITVANKIYWAGGFTLSPSHASVESSQVEMRDINSQRSTFAHLSQAKAGFGTVAKGNEIIFFMGGPGLQPQNFDIYNTSADTWSIGKLNEGLVYPAILSANNKIYVAGGSLATTGSLSNQVWLLQW